MSEIVVTEADNGSSISATVGDSLVIKLPEIPTTGYRWAPQASDAQIVELQTDEFNAAAGSATGGGGTRVLRYLVKRPGSAHLLFQLARSWEPGSPKQTFDLQVNAG